MRALVVDFDGTICPKDVSEELLGAFAPPGWWDVDLEFRRGEIGSRECLIRQASMLEGSRDDMCAFAVERYRVDPTFPPLARWAQGAGLTLTVASDGLGFYIEPMLLAAGVRGAEVLTNEVTLDRPGAGPRFAFPNAHPECVGCGTCKMGIVKRKQRDVGPVAFVGEGHTDRYGALYADVVFASKHLVDICRQDGVPFLPWRTFDDVRAGLEALIESPGAIDPDICPGWAMPAGA